MKWKDACDAYAGDKQVTLNRLAKSFGAYQEEYDQDGQFSNKFFYKIRDRLELLNPPQNNPAGRSPLTPNQAIDLMAAEYVNSGLCRKFPKRAEQLRHARVMVEPLLQQCVDQSGRYQVDAALLVRFLAQKEVS
ncbi:MAG: hypothetical protein R3E95_17195 [Thiolinea sp.]